MESQTLLRGLETPLERSDLYDDFDIHHERFSMGEAGGTEGANTQIISCCEGEAMKSMET